MEEWSLAGQGWTTSRILYQMARDAYPVGSPERTFYEQAERDG